MWPNGDSSSLRCIYLRADNRFKDEVLPRQNKFKSLVPSKHLTSQERRYSVAATSRRCSDAVATLCVCWIVVLLFVPKVLSVFIKEKANVFLLEQIPFN